MRGGILLIQFSLGRRRDFLSSTLKAKFLNRLAQPWNRWAIVNFLTGFDQERGRFRPWRQFVGFAQRCKLLIVLVSPVHIDAASLAIFYIVIIHGSTLWTLCHLYAPLVNKILHRIRLVRRKLDN
jgi:hypothetical protein